MTKNEIIEAINATIIPNGQKGITAESLANLLIEMVNATPEGGGGGSVKTVYLPLDAEITEEQKARNAEVYSLCAASVNDPMLLDGVAFSCMGFPCYVGADYTCDSDGNILSFDGVSGQMSVAFGIDDNMNLLGSVLFFSIGEDGSITLEE